MSDVENISPKETEDLDLIGSALNEMIEANISGSALGEMTEKRLYVPYGIDPDLTGIALFSRRRAYLTPDSALEAYALEFVRTQTKMEDGIHRDAAVKQIIASLIFSVILFLNLGIMGLYHRNIIILYNIIILLPACLLFYFSLRAISTGAALKRKVAAMPDAEIDHVLAGECDNMIDYRMIRRIIILIPAIFLAVLIGIFMKPHMIFEKNATGYGLRYYTFSFFPEQNIIIPATWKGEPVTEIRGNVFSNINSFTEVQLPPSIKEIRGNTFERCTGLRSIDIPDGVGRIGGHAFCDCHSLEEVYIPPSVHTIGSSAFRRCYALKSITIPSGCSVNERAFKESPTAVYKR